MIISALDSALDDIKSGEIELIDFISKVKRTEDKDRLLKTVRKRLLDKHFEQDRSIYCGIIRELNDKRSLPILWELLSLKETKGKRGSLVYAMENLNPIEYLEQLVELSISDNYEVTFNCLDVIDNLEGHVEAPIINRCIQKLKTALEGNLPDWKRAPLKELLDELEED